MPAEHVAIYGLGNMGYLLAERLAKRFALRVADLDARLVQRAVQKFKAQAIRQPQDLAQLSAVVLCLPNPDASHAVLQQIGQHLQPGTVVIETSTVNPDDVRASEKLLTPHGARLIDASILAGVSQMQAGSATLLLGGDSDAVAAVQDVLDVITPKQIHLGPLGAGAAAKVINNAVAHAVMVVVAEAGAMAKAVGVGAEQLLRLLADPQAGLHRPLTHRYAERIMHGDYTGGMPLDAARKDSMLALGLAQQLGVPLFAIQAAHTVYDLAAAAGYGRDDYAVIAKLWADWGKPVI